MLHRTIAVLLSIGLAVSSGGCVSSSPPTPEAAARTPTILTYNVLASEYHDAQRIPALLAILEQSQADVICLQEVLPAFLAQLQDQPWFKAHYHAPKSRGLDAIANGNYICARHAVERVDVIDHRSPQGRQSIIVHLRVDGRPLAIATCHLESQLRDGPIRARQLDDVFARLAAAGDAIFAGDFNFGDGEQPDTAHLDAGFVDLWSGLRPDERGFTWNMESNAMADRGAFFGEGSRRIDRILLRSERWRPQSVRIVGNRALDTEGLLFPSDHFGLLGVVVAESAGAPRLEHR